MEFIWWLTGVCATIAGIKFVILLFKRVTSKENLNAFIDSAEDHMNNGVKRVENYFKKKKAEKDNRPMVRIE